MIKYFSSDRNRCHSFFLLLFFLLITFFQSKTIAQTLSKDDTSNVRFLNSRKFYIYKVEKGETLYGISQKFNIPQEEILQFNKEINNDGLKAKMKLWIPAYSWQKKDSVATQSISPVKADKKSFHIAVISFLNLPKTYTAIDTSESYVEEGLHKEVKDNLEFIEGVIHSAELLKSEGNKVHLYIIDSENDSIKVLRKLKEKVSLNNIKYDVIVTNEIGNILKSISGYSKSKQIELLSCGINTFDLVKDNENALSLFPSSGKQCEQMGRFSGKFFSNSCLLTIKTGSPKENERSELFQSGFIETANSRVIQVDNLKSENISVADSLVKNKTNVVFISSSNEDFVSSVLNSLNTKILEYNIRVVGLPTWQYFESIDHKLIENCNVFVFNSGYIDFSDDQVSAFRKYFRDKFNAEPSDIAFHGYDAISVAGKLILTNDKKLIGENKTETVRGIYSDYSFVRSTIESAFENESIHVFQPANDPGKDLVKSQK